MKEDILEQIAEDYFVSQPGFFVKSNLKYRPDDSVKGYDPRTDSVHSDIDVVAINNAFKNEIYVINCKSWQGGLDLPFLETTILDAIKRKATKNPGKREFWMSFRELCSIKWSKAFVNKMRSELGIKNGVTVTIKYTILCTLLVQKKKKGRTNEQVISNLGKNINDYFIKQIDNKVNLIFDVKTLNYFIDEVIKRIKNKNTPAVENTHLARTFQLILASGNTILDKKSLPGYIYLKCSGCNKEIGLNKVWYCEKDCFDTHQFICQECHKVQNNRKCNICKSRLKLINRK